MAMKFSCIAVVLLLSSDLLAQKKATVVFVCEHGGARSTIASVYFNKMAEENNLPYRSTFRGLTPDSAITRRTKIGLIADGFDTKSLSPAPLSSTDVAHSSYLISLDCTIPAEYKTYRDWKGIPAISENYAAARDEIVKQVRKLIDDLKQKN